MEVQIVAGRFTPFGGAFALDLGTGERVLLHLEHVPPASSQQLLWTEASAALCGVWHASLAECLDFGLVGEGHRFAAFRARAQASAPSSGRWARTRRVVDAFLSVCGVAAGAAAAPYADHADQIVAVPTLAERKASEAARMPGEPWFGIRLVPRAALQVLTEHLATGPSPGLTVHRVQAAPGSGGRTFLRHLARSARRLGYLPVGSSALGWIVGRAGEPGEDWASVLSRHEVVLLHDGRTRLFEHRYDLVGGLLHLSSRDARPLMIVELTRPGAANASLQLAPLTECELVEMVVSHGATAQHRRRITRAARTCGGRPGPFVQRLVRIFDGRGGGAAAARFTVHEATATYSADGAPHPPGPVTSPPRSRVDGRPSPPADDVSPVIRGASALCARGRHAAATRALRQAEAAAARRGLWPAAADVAIQRALVAAARSRSAEAEQALFTGLDYCRRGACADTAVASAMHLGRIRLEDGRIDEAEGGVRTAIATATMLRAKTLVAWGSTLLALCLWWQDRADEARHVLGSVEPVDWRPQPGDEAEISAVPHDRTIRVWQECIAARVALAGGDVAQARARLTAAHDLAPPADGRLHGMLRRMEARWHAAVGDVRGFGSKIDEALALAVAARQPLDKVRALVGCVEGCRRLGVRIDAAALRRLERVGRRRLPGLLAFRVRVAVAYERRTPAPEQLAAECRARRLHALLSALPSTATPLPLEPRSVMFDDVIEVLRICQEDDTTEALRSVLDVVRARTHAAAAEFVSCGRAMAVTVPAGVGLTSVASRALETGLAIEPEVTERGVEAAVALRYGGRVVGALAGRWPASPQMETARLMSFLGAVGAAAAPCLGAAIERLDPVRVRSALDMELLGESGAMGEIRREVVRAAAAPFPVLIQGESGSGKELVARAVHRASARRGRPMCALNCAALPDDLLEAELFGHARGAFTGAVAERAGLFEDADGGVLFLDEVGELTPRAQAKLLRAIQEGEIKRVGETFPRKVDVRIVAATNRPLDQEVAAGRFRRDLRYRLDVIRIVLPPLRDRPDDIPALARHFWRSATDRVGSRAVLSSAALAALARYDWPGNVRELQNVLASLAVSAPRRGIVGPSALPSAVASTAARAPGATLESARRVFEERYVRAALARAGGHRGRAAAELGLTRQGLAKLMGRLGLGPAGDSPPAAERRCAS